MDLQQQALSLYKTVFYEDDAAFAEAFTNKFFEGSCRYILKDGKMVAMLYLIDATVKNGAEEYPAKYLYAAGVHPSYRGQGLMSHLINEAVKQEKIIITKPASESLFSFYKKFGFSVCAYKTEVSGAFQNEITTDAYINKRKELLKDVPHINLADEAFSLGGLTLYGDGSFIAAVDSDTGAVKEYVAKDEELLNGQQPFAMWLSTEEKLPKKVYFGIAMD
ncbi:MAG: GNAT family N-acetyltransferase [Clostridia bacterium]|nr:GNAT family N-acetyltransferase [Clostridia bacterium]